MTIKVTKPSINLREALSDLKQDTGLKGQELMRADTVAEARTAIGAGRKNLIINGGFDVWQRGTTSPSDTTQVFVADRWRDYKSSATASVSRQTFTLGQTDVPGSPRYFHRYTVAIGNNYCDTRQYIEDVTVTAGQTVTLSFWAKGTNPGSGTTNVRIQQRFGSGGSPTGSRDMNVPSPNITLTSSWQRFSFTVNVSTLSGTTLGTNNDHSLSMMIGQGGADTSTTSYEIDLSNVQLELGSVATEFEHRSYGEELALCQRYYEYTNNMYRSGYMTTGTSSVQTYGFAVTKRTTPTMTVTAVGSFQSATGATIQNATPHDFRHYATGGGGTHVRYSMSWTANAEL
jgi:hypothetical protein